MGKIINFPPEGVRSGSFEKGIVFLTNEAICDSTNEMLIDGEDIEERLERLKNEDTMENRLSLISGLFFFDMAIVIGEEKDWKEHRVKDGDSLGYAVFTRAEKIPSGGKRVEYQEFSFRNIIKELSEEADNVEIYVNPGSEEGFILTLQMLRYMQKIIDNAVDFADEQMKKGYAGEKLTDKMFERYEWRTVEITMKDQRKIIGEVTGCSYGDDPKAQYTVTVGEQEVKVARKEIAFIKEI